MINLEQYRNYFSQAYPDYADGEYSQISDLVMAIPTDEEAARVFSSADAQAALGLLLPLIKIKNYKSQIPFPDHIFEAAALIAELKNSASTASLLGNDAKLFEKLLSMKGFQLPTISAVLHFCHPEIFPIVDRNIEAACGLLSNECPDEFDEELVPALPAYTTSAKNKLSKYRAFIQFLTRVRNTHNEEHGTQYGYRELDKAMMVYGAPNFKIAAENANKAMHATSA